MLILQAFEDELIASSMLHKGYLFSRYSKVIFKQLMDFFSFIWHYFLLEEKFLPGGTFSLLKLTISWLVDIPFTVSKKKKKIYKRSKNRDAMWSDLICLFYLASGFQLSSRRLSVDEDLDLNVDGDDTELYGRPQYPLLWSTFNQSKHLPKPFQILLDLKSTVCLRERERTETLCNGETDLIKIILYFDDNNVTVLWKSKWAPVIWNKSLSCSGWWNKKISIFSWFKGFFLKIILSEIQIEIVMHPIIEVFKISENSMNVKLIKLLSASWKNWPIPLSLCL